MEVILMFFAYLLAICLIAGTLVLLTYMSDKVLLTIIAIAIATVLTYQHFI